MRPYFEFSQRSVNDYKCRQHTAILSGRFHLEIYLFSVYVLYTEKDMTGEKVSNKIQNILIT